MRSWLCYVFLYSADTSQTHTSLIAVECSNLHRAEMSLSWTSQLLCCFDDLSFPGSWSFTYDFLKNWGVCKCNAFQSALFKSLLSQVKYTNPSWWSKDSVMNIKFLGDIGFCNVACPSLKAPRLYGRCKQPRASHGWFLAEQPRAWAVWAGRLHTLWAEADPVWLRHCEHTPVLFVCSVPPSPQRDWTSEPKKKKVSSTVPFVSGRKPDTEETSKQKNL